MLRARQPFDGRPDLSGLWAPAPNPYRFDLIQDLQDEAIFRPAAEAVFQQRVVDFRRDDPLTNCLPGGPSDMLAATYRIMQSPDVVALLYENALLYDEIQRLNIPFCVHNRRAAPAGAGGTVTFAKSGKTTAADAATSLMDAGEQLGVQMPFGCRMGICQSCVVGLVDGHVRDLRTGVVHEPGTRVQTCISAASGDCTLDV